MALWWPGGDLIIISLATYRRRVTWVWETVCETSLLNERKLMIRICCYSQCRIFRRLQVQKVYTMDVNSLYSVIRNNSGLEALAYFLNKRPVLDPPTSTLTRLAELVLTLNAFTLNGDFYQQIGGVAMGSKMGPNYACLFVGYVEDQIASQYHGLVPQLHKSYIDDVIRVDVVAAWTWKTKFASYPTFILLFNLHTQSLTPNSLPSISRYALLMITSALPFTTRTLTPTLIFIISPHIPAIAKKVFLAVNSCDFAVCVLKTQIFWKRAVKWCLSLNNVDTPPPVYRTISRPSDG